MADEISCQQAVTDCVAEQSEGALAAESRLLRDLVATESSNTAYAGIVEVMARNANW